MTKSQINTIIFLLVLLVIGVFYTAHLMGQPTVFANEIVWAPNSTDTKYHRLFFSDGTVMRREKYQEYEWTPWRLDEDYPKAPRGR